MTEVLPETLAPVGLPAIEERKVGKRRDVTVRSATPTHAIDSTGIVAHLRRFFDAIEAEAIAHPENVIGNVQAFARVEAMLADLRYVRDSLRGVVAEALKKQAIRRLVVEGVVAVEAVSSIDRRDWQHQTIFAEMLARSGLKGVNVETGEVLAPDAAAEWMLRWFRPEWRLTPLREAGLDPDAYCTVATDDDGRPVSTPSIRTIDNLERQ